MSDQITDESGRVDKYWICDECAKANGWTPPSGGNTVIRGMCGHCKRLDEVFLTPTRDFRKPFIRNREGLDK